MAKSNIKPDVDDKDYYKNKVLSYMRSSTSRSSYIKYTMIKCYDYFEGANINNPYKSLSNVFNIDKKTNKGVQTLKMPTIFIDLNHIKAKIKALEGDLIKMGFRVHVESINKEAQSRKEEFKLKVLTDMALRPFVDHAAAQTGIEIGMQDDLPNTQAEFEKRFRNKKYKDISDMCMDACLKYSILYSNYKLTRLKLFTDVNVSGECHGQTFVSSGAMPMLDRINPISVYYPVNPNDDDLLSKTNAKGIMEYKDINEVMNQYNLSADEIEQAISLAKVGGQDAYIGIMYNNLKYFEPYLDQDKKQILVAKWKWTDSVKKAGVEITYADGHTEFRVIDTDKIKDRIDKKYLGIPDDAKFQVTRKKVSVLKKCTLLAGQLVVDYGEETFMIRDNENISMALSPIVSYKPYYFNGSNSSMVADLMKVQDFRNYLMTMVTLECTKTGGSALAIDVSKLPKEWGATPADKMGKVLHYLKGFGIIPYNSAEGERPGGANDVPVTKFDSGVGQILVAYVNLMEFMDGEMDKISGMNNARLGNIQSANQLNGVTEMAISSSNSISSYMYEGFFNFESRLLTYHLQHIKMCWIYNPERFTPIIGQFYFDFLKQDVDITMDTHAATVRKDPLSPDTLRQYLMLAVQANSLPLSEALKLELESEEDTRQAAIDYIDEIEAKRLQDIADQKAAATQQQQASAAQQQATIQGQQQMLQTVGQQGYQKQQLKSLSDLQKKKMEDQTKIYIADGNSGSED